ncbi:UBX domain-containing protein, partial [Aphelenchoides avenae]
LAVLLPDGKRENVTLTDNTPLKALFSFIAGRGCASADHLLQLNHPKREFGVDDGAKTLRELGIGRELVHVKSKLSG